MASTPRVLLITDRSQARRPLEEVVRAAIEGGCRWISLREKDLPGDAQVSLARAIARMTASYGARLMLHGDPRLAIEAGASGVHLASGGDVRAARTLLGPDAWVSASAHAVDEIEAAAAAGADAVTLSPVFLTTSKPGHGPAVGLDGLARAAEQSRIPIIALGGIEDEASAAACFESGAAAIAVMGAVMRADDPGTIMARLVQASGQAGAVAGYARRGISSGSVGPR